METYLRGRSYDELAAEHRGGGRHAAQPRVLRAQGAAGRDGGDGGVAVTDHDHRGCASCWGPTCWGSWAGDQARVDAIWPAARTAGPRCAGCNRWWRRCEASTRPPPTPTRRRTSRTRCWPRPPRRRAGARRSRLRRGGAGLLAAAGVAAAFVGGAWSAGPRDEPPVIAVDLRLDAPGLTADAGLVRHTWGTELKLEATGLRGARYAVTFVPDDGSQVSAGSSWAPVPTRCGAASTRPCPSTRRVSCGSPTPQGAW